MKKSFKEFLKHRLSEPLPGPEARNKMMPEPVDEGDPVPDTTTEEGHPSSVLIPIYPCKNENLHVILTLRTNTIRHAGQISFPGGRAEIGESTIETALRETREEIGINSSDIDITGTLSPFYLYRTHNRITPVVGFLDQKPDMQRNPNEVEEIITIQLDQLHSGDLLQREIWELPHETYEVPFWNFHRVPLWGATAMMMSELLVLYEEYLER